MFESARQSRTSDADRVRSWSVDSDSARRAEPIPLVRQSLGAADRRFVGAVVLGAVALSLAAVWHYNAIGLTLSHYDAKGHLVVARRIFDSLTPGWRQVGAVWLPLPHLLNALPVQVDVFYRTGASGVAISVASFALAVASLAWLVLTATGSRLAALAAATVLASDPHVLYLQATPMTEPLLLGTMTASIALLYRYVRARGHLSVAPPGLALAAACWTRYEAWPVMAAVVPITAYALWRLGVRPVAALRATARIALFPALAIVAFLVLSRATVGSWFVTDGFFVIDNKAYRHPGLALIQVWWGVRQLTGGLTLLLAAAGAVCVAVVGLARRQRAPLLLAFALVGTAALPWYAFFNGHPFRIRYMVVLVAAVAAFSGFGIGLLPRRLRVLAAALVIAAAVMQTPPFDPGSPLVAEAQWDRPNGIRRREVTKCLVEGFVRPNQKILASMGSLAHYMQELSQQGFVLKDFVHEGIGELWPEALLSPRRHVEWILFEEQAEGGDELTKMRKQDASFVDGFTRECASGGVALYRRNDVDPSGAARRSPDPHSRRP